MPFAKRDSLDYLFHFCSAYPSLLHTFQVFSSCPLSRLSLLPRPRPSCFSHVHLLSLFPPSFSALPPLPLVCWSLWLILKGKLGEWVGLERKESAALSPARSSLARLKRTEREKEKKIQRSFSLPSTSPAFFPSLYHSWVVWYLTFAVFQLELGSKTSKRRVVSPLSYSVIPPSLFPLFLSFFSCSPCYFFFLCLQTDHHSNVFSPSERREERNLLKYPNRHPRLYR